MRRKRNQIIAIKNVVRDWIYEEGDIKEFIRSGFNGIYSTSYVVVARVDPITSRWQARLSEVERDNIRGGGVKEEEIKAALWSLKPFKTQARMAYMQGSSKNFGRWSGTQ